MLLPLSNFRQQREADCLVACAAMVLDYLLVRSSYSRLMRVLGTTSEGTPFSNLNRLGSLGLAIRTGKDGELSLLQRYLTVGLPVIVAVRTWALPHWQNINTEHAITVVGLDEDDVYSNDPAFEQAPLAIVQRDFLAAWADRDYEYAVIGLAELNDSTKP